MRISDWSSDVFSSDLNEPVAGVEAQPEFAGTGLHPSLAGSEDRAADIALSHRAPGHLEHAIERFLGGETQLLVHLDARREVAQRDEIGRASCRERVCQYV